MPRYYLHIRRGTRLEKDPDGVDVPDLDTACAEAMKVARECAELWSDLPLAERNNMAFEIVDEAGQIVRIMHLSRSEQPTH